MRAAKAKKFGRFFARMMSQVRARSEAHAKPPHCQPMVDIEHRPTQPGYSKPARAEATRAVPESQVSCAPAPRPGRQRRGRCAGRRENVTADGPERRALSGSALPAGLTARARPEAGHGTCAANPACATTYFNP